MCNQEEKQKCKNNKAASFQNYTFRRHFLLRRPSNNLWACKHTARCFYTRGAALKLKMRGKVAFGYVTLENWRIQNAEFLRPRCRGKISICFLSLAWKTAVRAGKKDFFSFFYRFVVVRFFSG